MKTDQPTASPSRTRAPKLYHGWWVAFAAFCAAFGSVIFFNPAVLGVFSTSLESEFGWDRSEIRTMSALPLSCYKPGCEYLTFVRRLGGWTICSNGYLAC